MLESRDCLETLDNRTLIYKASAPMFSFRHRTFTRQTLCVLSSVLAVWSWEKRDILVSVGSERRRQPDAECGPETSLGGREGGSVVREGIAGAPLLPTVSTGVQAALSARGPGGVIVTQFMGRKHETPM